MKHAMPDEKLKKVIKNCLVYGSNINSTIIEECKDYNWSVPDENYIFRMVKIVDDELTEYDLRYQTPNDF